MKSLRVPGRAGGFTLIELLVTILVVTVGLLGMAKLQAAAIAESQVSRTRAVMALQAESLASAMRANRAYWGSTTAAAPGFTTTAGSAAVTDTGGTMGPPNTRCTSVATPCVPANLARYDAESWAAAFNQNFPTAASTVACSVATNLPTTCDITLSWTEHYVGINAGSAAASAASGQSYMIVHVQP